jgi:hypothetical protein
MWASWDRDLLAVANQRRQALYIQLNNGEVDPAFLKTTKPLKQMQRRGQKGCHAMFTATPRL